jgi:predicted glycosyltransferase
MSKNKTILVAPLHWGLGHATRCIPIIRSLKEQEFNVLLASDGAALLFLQKEFPDLESLELPSYNIRYPKIGRLFKWKMISLLPNIYQTMENEKKIIKKLVDEGRIQGIISDGRLGIRHPLIPSVFITHQLNVITGTTTFFSSRMYQKLIRKFDICWVPDIDHEILNFSGKLGRLKRDSISLSYMGILSRMTKMELPITIDILVLLSGPEPQRSILEEKLMKELANNTQRILIIQGIVESEQKWEQVRNISKVNFMQSEELEKTINKSEIVISRSGYSTIMDLAVLEKKVFFIPTPGQYEQEYLAKRLESLGIAPSSSQERFRLKDLNRVAVYKGLKPHADHNVEISSLFGLF